MVVVIVEHMGFMPECHGDLLPRLQLQNDRVPSSVTLIAAGAELVRRDHQSSILIENSATREVVVAKRAEAEVVEALHRSSEGSCDRKIHLVK